MEYVTDTHSLLWHLFEPRRLGVIARSVFGGADAGTNHIFVPTVVPAEMIMAVQRGRLPNVSISQLLYHLANIRTQMTYTLLSLSPATVIASHTLTSIPDIFDRLIVAEAHRLGLPLVTRDRVIQDAGVVTTVWE